MLLSDLQDRVLDRLGHATRSADKDLGSLQPEVKQVLPVVPHPILHVFAVLTLVLLATIRPPDVHGAHLLPLVQLVPVDVVAFRGSAAEEQERGGEVLPAGGDHACALLDEAAEGGDAGARADADKGRALRVVGQAEGGMRGPDGNAEGVALVDGIEIRGRDTDVEALAREGGGAEDAEADGCVVGVVERRGGDGAANVLEIMFPTTSQSR